MRGSKAKKLRREQVDRPNPGRVGGGQAKDAVREYTQTPEYKWKMVMNMAQNRKRGARAK